MNRDTFLLDTKHYAAIKDGLNLEQKGQLLDAIFTYHIGEDYKEHIQDPTVAMAFGFMQAFFERCSDRYQDRVEKNRAAAQKRWSGEPSEPMQMHANASKCMQSHANAHKDSIVYNNILDNKDNIGGIIRGEEMQSDANASKCIQMHPNASKCIDKEGDDSLFDFPIKEAREERKKVAAKKKEEKAEQTAFVESLESGWQELMKYWLEYKSKLGDRYKSVQGLTVFFHHLQKLSSNNIETAREIIDQSIANNWKGIFPLKQNFNPRQQPKSTMANLRESVYDIDPNREITL